MKQNINILLKDEKMVLEIWKILLNIERFLLNIQIISDNTFKDKSIEEYNSSKKCNVLIIFDDIIADILNNKKT